MIPVKGVRVTVVAAGGKALRKPLAGGGQPNEFAVPTRPPSRLEHNTGSVGLLFEFGQFRILDLADLLIPEEYDLMCPVNLVGKVDLFMVSHHGLKVSNSKFLIHAIAPRVSIMNNGPRKGGAPEVFEILRISQGMQDIWQLHYAMNSGEETNSPERFIANLEQDQQCQANLIRVSATRGGSFTITNTRSGFSRSY